MSDPMIEDSETPNPGEQEQKDEQQAKEEGGKREDRKNRYLLIASLIALLIGIFLLFLVVVLNSIPKMVLVDQYALVFDARSTHTDLAIFNWTPTAERETPKVKQVQFTDTRLICDVEGAGISSYASDPAGAGNSLKECLADARTALPPNKQNSSFVFLAATGEMELLDKIDEKRAKAVMESVRQTLSQSGFLFNPSYAEIITGKQESAAAWITANILLRQLQINNETFNIFEMGDSSTQIAFQVIESKEAPDLMNFTLFGFNYYVSSTNFPCFGVVQMVNRIRSNLLVESKHLFYSWSDKYVIEDPCLPSGYRETKSFRDILVTGCAWLSFKKIHLENPNAKFIFKGEFQRSECLEKIELALNNNKCRDFYSLCFDRSLVPSYNGPFKAISVYYEVANFFKFTSRRNKPLSSLVTDECQYNWESMQKRHREVDKERLKLYCMAGLYVESILKAYGFDTNAKWDNIEFVNMIDNSTLDWRLGFITLKSTYLPVEKIPEPLIEAIPYYTLLAISFIIIIVAVITIYIVWAAPSTEPELHA